MSERPRPGIAGLLVAEVQKLAGRPWLPWAMLAPALMVALHGLSTRIGAVQQALAVGGGSVEGPLVGTAFQPAAQALRVGSLTAAALVAIAGALALAEERRLGTLRTLLAGPVRKWRFFAAKVVGIMALSVVLVVSAALVALAAGAFLGDYVALEEWEYEGHTLASMWRTLGIAVALSAAAVFAVGCLGLLCSALTSTGAAALVLLAALVAAGAGMHGFVPASAREVTRAFSPLSYVAHPAEFLGDQVAGIGQASWCFVMLDGREQWEVWLAWIVCILGGTLFGGIGLLVFTRRQVL